MLWFEFGILLLGGSIALAYFLHFTLDLQNNKVLSFLVSWTLGPISVAGFFFTFVGYFGDQ